jgi:hypothetical protein
MVGMSTQSVHSVEVATKMSAAAITPAATPAAIFPNDRGFGGSVLAPTFSGVGGPSGGCVEATGASVAVPGAAPAMAGSGRSGSSATSLGSPRRTRRRAPGQT